VLDGLQKIKPGAVVNPTPAAEQALADQKGDARQAGQAPEVAQR
jgi:hypothetical protein